MKSYRVNLKHTVGLIPNVIQVKLFLDVAPCSFRDNFTAHDLCVNIFFEDQNKPEPPELSGM